MNLFKKKLTHTNMRSKPQRSIMIWLVTISIWRMSMNESAKKALWWTLKTAPWLMKFPDWKLMKKNQKLSKVNAKNFEDRFKKLRKNLRKKSQRLKSLPKALKKWLSRKVRRFKEDNNKIVYTNKKMASF